MHMSDSKESQIHIQQIHADRHAGVRILTGVRIHNQTEEPHSLNRQPKSQKCSKSKKRCLHSTHRQNQTVEEAHLKNQYLSPSLSTCTYGGQCSVRSHRTPPS